MIKNRNCKPVMQILNGKEIGRFPSLELAAKAINGNSNCIWRCLKGRRNKYRGFQWEYVPCHELELPSHKTCTKCKKELPMDEFYQSFDNRSRKSYPMSKCKKCQSNYNKSRYQDTSSGYKKKAQEYQIYWRKNNPEKVKNQRLRNQKNLTDNYIKRLLTQSTGIKYKQIPNELIDVERTRIKLHRKIKPL